MSDVNELLDIILITYNRRKYLEVTLNKMLSENSPIRDYPITVIDNNSTDGTSELCQDFANRFPNLNYIKNKKNVGLSGNICKAMEYAERKYFWIVCDNDDLEFTAWSDVENAMRENKDLILVCRDYYEGEDKNFYAFVLNQLTFLPSGIYKTEHLTDHVMSYAMADTYTVLPHLPLGCAIINKKGSVSLVSKSIVTLTSNVQIDDIEKYDFDRLKQDPAITKNERTKSINFPAGIVASFDACQDEEVRMTAITNFTRQINGKFGPFLNLRMFYYSQAPKYIKKEFVAKLPLNIKLHYYLIRLVHNIANILLLNVARFKYYPEGELYLVSQFNDFKICIWSWNWLFSIIHIYITEEKELMLCLLSKLKIKLFWHRWFTGRFWSN